MGKHLQEVYEVIAICIIISCILIPLFNSMSNAYNDQGKIYEKKTLRYEEVIKND